MEGKEGGNYAIISKMKYFFQVVVKRNKNIEHCNHISQKYNSALISGIKRIQKNIHLVILILIHNKITTQSTNKIFTNYVTTI